MSIKQSLGPTLTTHAADAYLNVSHAGMNRWRKEGGGPAYARLGQRTIRYRVSDLDAFLISCVTQTMEG